MRLHMQTEEHLHTICHALQPLCESCHHLTKHALGGTFTSTATSVRRTVYGVCSARPRAAAAKVSASHLTPEVGRCRISCAQTSQDRLLVSAAVSFFGAAGAPRHYATVCDQSCVTTSQMANSHPVAPKVTSGAGLSSSRAGE